MDKTLLIKGITGRDRTYVAEKVFTSVVGSAAFLATPVPNRDSAVLE